MIDTSIEQRAILALGWLRRARQLVAGNSCTAKDMPPGNILQSPQQYVQEQYKQAKKAVETLTNSVITLRDNAITDAQRAQHERNALPAHSVRNEKAAHRLNEKARQLVEAFEQACSAATYYEHILRILRNEAEQPLPTLPLHQYAAALERLAHNEYGKRQSTTRTPGREPQTSFYKDSDEPLTVRAYHAFLQRTERSDRISLVIALIFCFLIAASGFYYVYNWGKIELEIIPLDTGRVRVRCINSTHNAVLLNVPYDGEQLPRDPVVNYGLLLELLDEDNTIIRPEYTEAPWEYKDMPAHLHGPIVISPLSAVELSLDLSAYPAVEGKSALRFKLFRAPQGHYRTYTTYL